ncbi:MAG: CZB domain-containing protein [Thermoleophilia bacterium]|nr:CZB domain-containing protein [Thermoleophilia bacterium]
MGTFKEAHLRWVDRVRGIVAGREKVTEQEIVGHTECALGKWYYGGGERQLRNLAEFRAIDAPHQQFHHAVRATVGARNGGNLAGARAKAELVERISHEIVAALDQLARRVSATDAAGERRRTGAPISRAA